MVSRFGRSHLLPTRHTTTVASQLFSIFSLHLSRESKLALLVKSKIRRPPTVPLKNISAIAWNFSWPSVSQICKSATFFGTVPGISKNLWLI